MASSASFPSSSGAGPHHRLRFGDTTMTKVFVGGLAWETPREELKKYFDKFGEILEAVIINDKNTGRSKGYGFVTFREPEAARRAVAEPNPVIDGRRANCNIAAFGRPRPSPPRGGRSHSGSTYQSPPQPMGPHHYTRLPAQMASSPPPPMIYQTPYGYLAYPAEFGYQQAMYSPQMASLYYQQMYGPTSPPNVGGPPSPYPFSQFGYPMQSPRGSFPSTSQAPRPLFLQYPAARNVEGSFTSSSSPPFVQLQPPPQARDPVNTTTDSPAPQQPSTSNGNIDQSPTS